MTQEPVLELSLLQRFLRRLHLRLLQVVRYERYEYAELQAAGMTLLWGALLLWPWWNTFSVSPAFADMRFWSENTWGLLFSFVGVLGFLGLFLEVWRLRRIAIVLNFALWSFVTTLLWHAIPEAPWWLVTVVLAGSGVWAFLRMRIERIERRHV